MGFQKWLQFIAAFGILYDQMQMWAQMNQLNKQKTYIR